MKLLIRDLLKKITFLPIEQRKKIMSYPEVRRLGGFNMRDRLLHERMAQTCDARDPRCNVKVATAVNNLLVESACVRPSMYDAPNSRIQTEGQRKFKERVLDQHKCENPTILRPQMPEWRQQAENPTVSLETSRQTEHLDALRAAYPVNQQLRRIEPVGHKWSHTQ